MVMQPNQPYDPNASGPNPYDFLQDKPAGKKTLLPSLPSGNSKKQRTIIAVVVGFIVLLVIGTIFALVFSGAPSNKEELLSLAKQQNEIIRIADIGVQKSRDAQAKNLALIAKLTLTTDQQPLLSALKAQKVKITPKELTASKDSKNDEILNNAVQANKFDDIFIELLQSKLTTYQQSLKKAYDNPATGKKLKDTLDTQYKNASLIIGVKPED